MPFALRFCPRFGGILADQSRLEMNGDEVVCTAASDNFRDCRVSRRQEERGRQQVGAVEFAGMIRAAKKG